MTTALESSGSLDFKCLLVISGIFFNSALSVLKSLPRIDGAVH